MLSRSSCHPHNLSRQQPSSSSILRMLLHRGLRLPLLRTLGSMRRSTVAADAAPAASVNVRDTRLVFAEVVGEQALRGRPISAGPLLKTIDGFAASVAENVIAKPMVMAAAERVDITARVFHGDLVRFEGQLLYTGRSSVTVQVTGHRRGIHDRAFEQALSAVMTLVAVDENGRPATSGVPKLVDTDDSTFEERIEKWAGNRKALSARWAQAQAKIDALGLVPRDMLEYPSGGGVSVGESRVEFATGFMPNQLNANGTVYGGELLRWMDNTAVFCAQSFTHNENVVTVRANRVSFILPVTMEDFVTLSASITHVSGSRMEIAVDVFLKSVRLPGVKKSHTGYFTIANLGDDNSEVPVRQQLSVNDDDQVGLRAVVKAQRRAELAEEEAELFALEPLEVSADDGAASLSSKL